MLQTTQLKANKMLIHESGTYNQQFGRAFTTQLNGRTEQMIAERIGDDGTISAASMANIANQFIVPTAQPERIINPYGVNWNERRMRFVLELTCDFGGIGARTIIVVLGSTNHLGLSVSGAQDPNMVFTINSIVTMRETVTPGPHGNYVQRSISDNSHVLSDPNFTGIRSSGEIIQRMRPEDVFATMTRTAVPNLDESFYDQRTAMTKTAVLSNRRNNIPTNFMASILDTNVRAHQMSDMGQSPKDVIGIARTHSHEMSAGANPFLSALSAAQNGNIGATFTMRDLREMDPHIDQVTRASFMTDTIRQRTHQAGQSQEWGGSDAYTLFATILTQSVPSLMMDLMMTSVTIMATNRHIDGQHKVGLTDVKTFTEMDMTQYGNMFISRFITEILNDLTMNNQMSYYLKMTADLLGETRVEIALNGDSDFNAIPYVTPSFCDALLVPCVTTDVNRAVTLAGDFESLATNLSEIIGSASARPVAMPATKRSY
jgi:hypothetical protein